MAEKDPKEVLKETLETVEVLKDSFNSLGAIIKDKITDNLFEVDNVSKSIGKNISNDISKGFSSLGKKSEDLLKNQDLLNKGQAKSKDIQKQINELANKELQLQGDISNALTNNLINKSQQAKLEDELRFKIKETTDELNKQLTQAQRIEKAMGNLGKLVGGLNKIPIIGQFIKTEKVLEEMQKKAAETGSKFQVMLAGIKAIGGSIKDAILDPLTLITFFLKAAVTANKESVNISKNLGYSATNADRVRASFVSIEANAGYLTDSLTATNVTTANLSEAFSQLSESTGFVSEYSSDALITQIKLTKQLGLTGDEAAGVYKFSALTGQSSEATYQSMLRGYVATRNALGVGVPFKAAIAEASKVSGQLAANMGYNAENTIRGVVATRALGTSLEQAKIQGESLLDFQTSIENELKAELITGQQLNLERARAAALMGDQVTVAEELASQGMTAAKFSGMNVIAQKSFAEALGTTSDELANQLSKREMALASGKSLAQITAEEADEAAKRQDIQERFNNAMLKLQSIIGNLLAGPLGSFLETLSSALEIINYFATPLKFILGTYLAINAAKKIALGYDIAMNAAARINQSLGQSTAATSMVKNQLEKQSLLTRIAGNVQLFYQLASEHGIAKALQIQFGFQQATNVAKGEGLLITMRDFIAQKANAALNAVIKTGLVVINGLKTIGLAISRRETLALIGQAAVSAFKGTLEFLGKALGPLAIPLAALAGSAALGVAYSFTKGDDVMSEGGYGKRTLLTPEGTIKLNDKDTVIAGTNLGGGDKINSVKSTPAMDITPMISAINQVTAAVNTLSNKSWDVKLDSKSVGAGLIQNSYRSA